MKINRKTIPPILFLAACVVYYIIKFSYRSLAYLDFGDGNYLYISWRLAQGDLLYEDIISPQPPVMLYMWSFFHRIIPSMLDCLYFFRNLATLIHIGCAICVYAISREIFKKGTVALISGVTYLLLPIGFWWYRSIESEPLEMLFSLAAFYLLVRPPNRYRYLIAGILSALAFCTNMTFLPYFLLIIVILLYYRPIHFKSYLLSSIAAIAIIFGIMTILTGTDIWINVFINQFNTYPTAKGYFQSKLLSSGGIIVQLEATFLILFFAGLYRYLRNKKYDFRITLLALYALQSFGSYFFVTKGGTVDYIFTIGEPFVAIFAGYMIYTVFDYALKNSRNTPLLTKAILFVGLFHFLLVVYFVSFRQNYITLQGENYEATPKQVTQVRQHLRRYSKDPSDEILAPPYYAYLAQRKIVENYSSSYIVYMKYISKDPITLASFERIIEKIRNKKLPIIVLNKHQFGSIKALKKSIENNYRQIDELQTRHENLGIYIPKK